MHNVLGYDLLLLRQFCATGIFDLLPLRFSKQFGWRNKTGETIIAFSFFFLKLVILFLFSF
jgi:hypothetical protein